MKSFCPICNVIRDYGHLSAPAFKQVLCDCGTTYRFPLEPDEDKQTIERLEADNARLSKTEVDLNRWLGLHRGQVTDLQKALRNLMDAELPSDYTKARAAAITVLEETDS